MPICFECAGAYGFVWTKEPKHPTEIVKGVTVSSELPRDIAKGSASPTPDAGIRVCDICKENVLCVKGWASPNNEDKELL